MRLRDGSATSVVLGTRGGTAATRILTSCYGTAPVSIVVLGGFTPCRVWDRITVVTHACCQTSTTIGIIIIIIRKVIRSRLCVAYSIANAARSFCGPSVMQSDRRGDSNRHHGTVYRHD
jgi:hypothetical protein